MMHFDLLRIFAKSPKVDPSGAYIPYVEKHPSKNNIPISTQKVLEKVIADLDKAKDLTAKFDTLDSNYSTFKSNYFMHGNNSMGGVDSYDYFYSARRYRLCYPAIMGLLSRVCLYANLPERVIESANYFEKLVSKKIIKWTPSYKLTNSTSSIDRKRSYDIVFALFNDKFPDIVDTYFGEDVLLNRKLIIEDVAGIYANNTSDKRKKMIDSNGISEEYKMGYHKNDDKTGFIIPNIRLSEIYYNGAEAIYDENPEKARELINAVEKARGVSTSKRMPSGLEKDEFMEWLVSEYRKEFIGEGQLFYLYKRLNIGFKYSLGEIENDGNCFLPIPLSESGL